MKKNIDKKIKLENTALETELNTEGITEPVTEVTTEVVPQTEVKLNNNEVDANPVISTNDSVVPKEKLIDKIKKYKKYIFMFVGLILIIAIVVFILLIINKEDRTETLVNIEKDNNLKFEIDGKEYYLGRTVSNFKKNGLYFDTNRIKDTDYILSDSISVSPFYYNEEAMMLGALYCSNESNCKYDDAILIKANFYEKSDVLIDDFLKLGLTYDAVREEYGKEEGKFYQDKSFLVWTFGEDGKIGEPYYLIRFNSSSRVDEIRIGVWWYEEEFEYTVE